MKKTDDWKDRLIAQQEETILWQAKRISELMDQQFAMVGQPEQKTVLARDNAWQKQLTSAQRNELKQIEDGTWEADRNG